MRFLIIESSACMACCVLCLALSFARPAWGQNDRVPGEDSVIAHVGEHKIYLSQVEWQFQKSFGDRELTIPLANELRAGILNQLVRQQLAMIKLSESTYAATDDEVALGIARLEEQATRSGSSLDEWLAENHQSKRCLRFNLAWQISWQRFIDATLTDDVLQKYFERHREVFDGTKVKVAHLLLPTPAGGSAEDMAKLTERAAAIRQQISDGELTWTEAVKLHSSAPTATAAGELGWIEYERPMTPEFTQAAFRLKPDETSPPVHTSAGVHLIKCLAVEQGTNRWYDNRRKIKSAAVQDLFNLTADRQEKLTEIRLADPLPWSTSADDAPAVPESAPDKNGI